MMLGAVLVIALSLVSIRSAFVSAVALEQTARCGAEEHCHTLLCYENSCLHCGKSEHTHNRNCYLVLLKDNDINSLLGYIDRDESHSLESLIYRTVDTAIQYNDDLALVNKTVNPAAQTVVLTNPSSGTPEPQPTPTESPDVTEPSEAVRKPETPAEVSLQDVNISELNETITDQSIEPNLILNENLYNAAAVSTPPGDTVAMLGAVAGSGGVSTFAVGDSPNVNDGFANFYINLDGEWVCIGTLNLQVGSTGWGNWKTYYSYLSTNDILALINDALGTEYARNNLYLGWDTAFPDDDDNWDASQLSQGTTRFGEGYGRESDAKAVRYIVILEKNDSVTKFYTVTFNYEDGSVEKMYVKAGTQITLPDGTWMSGNNTYTGGDWYTVNGITTFSPPTCTVTYQYPNGDTSTQTVTAGTQVTLPTGYDWTANGTTYEGGSKVTVNSNITFVGSVPVYYTVTYQYPDRDPRTESVKEGKQIQLPEGYKWTVNGVSHNGGDRVTITGDTLCIGSPEPIQVRYTVNFPMRGYDYGHTVTAPGSSPTVYGTTQTTSTFTVQFEEIATIRTVSQTIVRLNTSHNYKFKYPVMFLGWESESGELISPYSRLTWSELQAYDTNHDGYVNMTGKWAHGVQSAVNFFVLYNANVGSTDGSSGNYTPSIYSTHASNPETKYTSSNPMYNATTDAGALSNDPKIRDMYGEKADKMWFTTFPTDEEIFEALKNHVGRLTVDGEQVNVEDLNSNEYAIRWYKVVYYGDDGWHVDGKLTRKVGVIEVSKTFAGNDTLIAAAKTNFSITATNGTRTVTLNSRNAVDDEDGNPNTWLWRIENVKYDERWTLTESDNTSSAVIHYPEWSISDASANSQTSNGTGNSVTVRGVTYASDLENPEWLRVDFNNIYYRKDSLMIKKADGVTGEALSGATFQLYQNDTRMTFDFDSNTGMYVYNPSGNGTYNTLSGNGYMNIAAQNFSYDNGPITVREITAPTNYNPVGDIKVGYTDTGQKTIGIVDPVDYAKYHDGLLVVYNSANTMNVTAEKIWECEESEWQDITVQLFANGSANLAATLTGAQSTQADLTRSNGYRYTWNNLPIYAYGAKVEWSIKETRIGTEDCKADYTFANWAVSYDAAVRDANGNVTLSVHNTPKRPMLYLTKTNADGSAQLAGATFSLTQVTSGGTPVNGFVTRTATTNDQGVIIFDNLLYGVRYRIVEDKPPPGYKAITQPIYLTIAAGGEVVVESHSNAKADAVLYNVVVTNISEHPLPETGGSGPGVSYGLGGALMLLAAYGYILLKPRERGRRQSSP